MMRGFEMGKLEGEFFVEENPELIEKLELLGAGVREGDVLRLPLLESAYFQKKGAIDTGASIEELLGGAGKLAKERFIVLCELRNSGYIVRMGSGNSEFMRVYKRGIRVGEDRTETVVKVLEEGEKQDLLEDLASAGKMRKNLVYAFVGADEKINFVKAYRVRFD